LSCATRRPLASIVILLGALMSAACAGFAAKGEAEAAVAGFHQMLDAERYDEIYDATDDLFKGATTRSDFTAILQAVHRKLGGTQSSAETNFYAREQAGTNAGSYISLIYDTAYEQGHATESFNWKVVAGEVRLVGYNVKSSLLVSR
jgi:hypothetical protein